MQSQQKLESTKCNSLLSFTLVTYRTWELMAPWTGAVIKVPTKFVTGDEESVYHFPGVKDYIDGGDFKKDVPLLEEVVVIKGAAHFINQVKPDEISAQIYDFIKKF